jgi:hypothetical protein
MADMKLRHVAAMVLCGWYQLAPPELRGPSAPLGKWQTIGTFDHVADCERADLEYLDNSLKSPKKFVDIHPAECIASDDPRLKEK